MPNEPKIKPVKAWAVVFPSKNGGVIHSTYGTPRLARECAAAWRLDDGVLCGVITVLITPIERKAKAVRKEIEHGP